MDINLYIAQIMHSTGSPIILLLLLLLLLLFRLLLPLRLLPLPLRLLLPLIFSASFFLCFIFLFLLHVLEGNLGNRMIIRLQQRLIEITPPTTIFIIRQTVQRFCIEMFQVFNNIWQPLLSTHEVTLKFSVRVVIP